MGPDIKQGEILKLVDEIITKEEQQKPLKGKIEKPKVVLDDGDPENNLDQIGKIINYKIIQED